MSNYLEALDESVNVSSAERGFRTVQHAVGTYEQTERGVSYFYLERIVDEVGIQTEPLHL